MVVRQGTEIILKNARVLKMQEDMEREERGNHTRKFYFIGYANPDGPVGMPTQPTAERKWNRPMQF